MILLHYSMKVKISVKKGEFQPKTLAFFGICCLFQLKTQQRSPASGSFYQVCIGCCTESFLNCGLAHSLSVFCDNYRFGSDKSSLYLVPSDMGSVGNLVGSLKTLIMNCQWCALMLGIRLNFCQSKSKLHRMQLSRRKRLITISSFFAVITLITTLKLLKF